MTGGEPVHVLIDEARRLRTRGDRNASLAAFIQAVQSDSSNSTAIIECGYDHLHLSQIPEAQAAFEGGLALEPDNKAALIGLGHTFRHLRQLDNAERAFRRVIELEPGHGGGNMGLGYTLKSLGRREEALEAFQAAAKSNPANTAAQIEVSHLLRDLARPTDAIVVLREVVKREPSNLAHSSALARLLKQTGNLTEATQVFRELVAADPSNLTYRIELGHLLREIDALDEAKEILDFVLREAPENSSALVAMGWLHRKAKRLGLATEAFQKVVELDGNNIGALHALALIAREEQDHERALKHHSRASQIDPKALYIRLEVCNSLQNLKQFDKAIEEFNQILTEWPGTRAAHLGLGYALRSNGRIEESLSAFDAASRDDPSHPNAPIESGHALLRLGRPLEAEARFRSGLDRSPGNVSALVGLSYALRRLGRMDEAEVALREVLAAQPDNNGARLALGHVLEAQYRLDEAAQLFADVLANQPDHADSLAALGNIHRRQGHREQALDCFRRAAEVDSGNKTRLVDVAVELRDLGQFEASATTLSEVLATDPANVRALMQRGQLLRREDLRTEALSVFRTILSFEPQNAQAMVEIAAEERALGRPLHAKEWLERALDTETNHIGALLALAEIAAQSDDPEGALALYKQAAAAHPTSTWAQLGAARTTFELGERDEAFRLIARAREELGHHPEMIGIEVELLRHLREWTRALAILQEALEGAGHRSFWLWAHKVQILTTTGQYDAAENALQTPPATSVTDRARVALVEGQLAEARFRYETAIVCYKTSIQLNPGDAWAHFELSRAALIGLDIKTSRAALGDFVRLSRASLLLKGQSLSPSQNHVGQLLDEFVLDAEAFAELLPIRMLPAERQLDQFRAILAKYPDYTPAAILACIALRQSGRLDRPDGPSGNLRSPIPPCIVQFWDADPPDDVRDLMASWQRLNPDHGWTLFDDEAASDFLRSEYDGDILQAYQRTQLPAQKADLFRLAYLAARGGIYVDADDRCLVPLSNYIRPDATLVVHQENYGSIGNNFIAVTPEHPVIIRALDMAATAINRGDTDLVWLSTGPGLLTRAFAQEWTIPRPGGLLRRTQVMELGELQRVVGIHCPVRYKSTDRHWSRAAFGKAKRRVTMKAATA